MRDIPIKERFVGSTYVEYVEMITLLFIFDISNLPNKYLRDGLLLHRGLSLSKYWYTDIKLEHKSRG